MSQAPWDRLERRTQAVAERAVHAYAAASPHYGGVVPEHLELNMAHTCREIVRLYVRLVRERRDPREDELRLFAERGADRGAERLPVAELLQAYFFIAEAIWAELSDVSADLPAEAAGTLFRCIHRVAHAGVQAHQEETEAAHGEEREAMRDVVRALVAGEPAAELAARFEIRLADAYGILALRLAAHPTEAVEDTVGRRLAGHRKVHRLIQHLRRELPDALAALDPGGGLVLAPSTSDPAAIRAVLPKLQRATGIAITAGYAYAPTVADIPTAANQARKLLELTREPGEVAVLEDRLFEYQIAHDSEARPRLASIAARLREEPELLTTITTYFATDFHRRETARRLHVHPNTVDNRLSRITTLTGANPRTAQGLLVLGAALSLATAATTPTPAPIPSC
ncbi:PucR family transcriptional regulator [Amycolatopsis dongchuanensis]